MTRILSILVFSLFLNGLAVAQGSFEGTPITVVPEGTLVIQYSDPSRANQQVTISIDDGGELSDEVQIQLDGQGDGDTEWGVPEEYDWIVYLSDGEGRSHTTTVVE